MPERIKYIQTKANIAKTHLKFVATYVVGKQQFAITHHTVSKSPGGNLMRVRFPPPAPFDINGLGVTLNPFFYVLQESIVPGFVPTV